MSSLKDLLPEEELALCKQKLEKVTKQVFDLEKKKQNENIKKYWTIPSKQIENSVVLERY